MRTFSLILLAVFAWGGTDDPLHLVRLGNAAYDRGEFEAALEFFLHAENEIDDPGLVAFNEAAALYQLGRYRDAEVHYLRCRADAGPDRLPRVLFDLGNCLVRDAQVTDAGLLQRAIGYYQECLRQDRCSVQLAGDVRHNLDIAKALLLKAKALPKHPDSDPRDDDGRPGRRNQRPGDVIQGFDPSFPGPDVGDNGQPALPDESGNPSTAGSTSNQAPPGRGNLPTIPDTDEEPVTLSSDVAAALLEQATTRIIRDRQEHQRGSKVPAPPKVKDW